jgi:hypothetical protein
VLKEGKNPGAQAEWVQASLGAGTYYVQVKPATVTVGSGGTWEIQSPELADGDYKLAVKTVLATGKEQKVAQDWAVKIDTVNPDLKMVDLIDGIAWGSGESLNGNLLDRDQLSKVEYWFKNAPGMKQTLSVVDGKVSGALGLPSGIVPFTQQTVVFRSWDRAGNISELKYDFMVMGSDDKGLISEDGKDVTPDSSFPFTDWMSQGSMNSGGAAQYVGSDGGWGRWGWGSGGSSPSWNAAPTTPTGPAATPNPAFNLNVELNYIEAIQAIAQIAYASLSNAPSTQAKKKQLAAEFYDLDGLAGFVQRNNLYDVMGPVFHGLFQDAYDGDGKMSRAQAIAMGKQLAQKIARDPLNVEYKGFQAEIWGTVYQALNLGATGITQVQRDDVFLALTDLSKSYFKMERLNEVVVSSGTVQGGNIRNFLDALRWRDLSLNNNGYSNIETVVMQDLAMQFAGQSSPTQAAKAIRNVDRLLQSAYRVVDLHTSMGLNSPYQSSYVRYGGMLRELMELGFEISRSNPTVTSGDNPMSEWIETLIEATDTGWKEKGMRSVTGGLSEWFEGFDLGPLLTDLSSDGHNGRWQMPEKLGKAIEYAGRLVQAARAIDDVSLMTEVKRADFLSHLVNLGGAYSSFIPGWSGSSGFFLETIKNAGTDETLVNGVSELEVFLKKYDTGSEKEDLRIARNTLRVMSNIPTGSVQQEIRNPLAVRAWMHDVLSYAAIKKTLQNGESIFDPSGLYEMILKGEGNQTFVQAAQEFYAYALPSPVLVASVANNLGTLAQEGSIGKEAGKGIWWGSRNHIK